MFIFFLSPKNNSWNILSSTVWNCHYSKIKYWWVLTLRIAGLSAMIISGIIYSHQHLFYCLTHVTAPWLSAWMTVYARVQGPGSVSETGGVSLWVVFDSLLSTDCGSPGSSVYGFLQTRILEWVSFPFSNGCSWPRDQSWVSCVAGRFFTIWAGTQFHFFGFANNHQNNPKTPALPYHLWPYFWLL